MKLNIPFNNYQENNIFQFFGVFLISIYPMTFFWISSFNTCVVLLDIIFIIEILRKRHFKFFNNTAFYSLIFLWTVLIINLFFSVLILIIHFLELLVL